MQWIRTLLIVSCSLAPALGVAAEPAPVARKQAQSIYAEGEKAFAQGHFEEALAAFQKAYLLDPVPVLLYNIARTNEELGRFSEAIRYFESYLARVPDAPDRKDVEQRLVILRKAAKVEKDAANARAEAEQARAEAEKAKAAVEKAETEKAAADRIAAAAVSAQRQPEPRSNWLAWTLVGTGGVMTLLGTFSWISAGQSVKEAEDIVEAVGDGPPTAKQRDAYSDASGRASSQGAAGWALIGLGVTAGVVGFFLYESEPDAPAVGVAPTLNGLGLYGRF